MTRDLFIKSIVPETVCMTPEGVIAKELSPEEFKQMYKVFIESVLAIKDANIDGIVGYGEFNENNRPEYSTCREFLVDTFSEDHEDYWKNWREMFGTTMLTEEFFEKYYEKMLKYAEYCEGQRYLVNNNTFFVYMITDKKNTVGFADWSRAGITDFLIDFVIMDLNKPYLQIPELLYQYCRENHVEIEHFQERFLCMAYFKGLDVLRWHASIDDEESCTSIMKSIEELETRINNLK